MNTDYPRKVKYSDYVQGFTEEKLNSFVEDKLRNLSDFDTETMRGLVYGYTFTEDYAKGTVPDTLSMDYWRQKDPHISPKRFKNIREFIPISFSQYIGHGGRIRRAIESTGNGTIEHPYCVICVEHEYELLKRLSPGMTIKRQYLLPGYIDCFECEEEECSIPHVIYFDISRWFERVKLY